jgi:hypothetical protein
METVKSASDFPLQEGHPSQPLKIPTGQELYDFFNQFMLMWLRLPSQRVDRVESDIPLLPNERGLMFMKPTAGILVIRTSEDFAKGLVKLAGAKETPGDLFVEMIVLFWHRFVSKFWGLDSRRLPPAVFKKSLPKHWPERKPDSALTVFVLQQAIELRLWVAITEVEMERWKKP